MKVHSRIQYDVAGCIQYFDRCAEFQVPAVFGGYGKVNFQPAPFVDRSEHGCCGYAIAYVYRNVSHNAGSLRMHLEVTELNILLLDLRVHRLYVSVGRVVRRLRLVEVLTADDSRRKEPLSAIQLHLRQLQRCFFGRALGFPVRHRRRLPSRIDLHQRLALLYDIA